MPRHHLLPLARVWIVTCALFTFLGGALPAQELDLPQELAQLVDLADPAARRKAAIELARRPDVTLDALLAAMRAFGTFTAIEPGIHREQVALRVGKQVENTEHNLYVPRGYDPAKPAPLMLMAHGSAGNGRELHHMWQATADALGMLVLSPTEAGKNEGYAFSDRERLSALASLRWVRRRCNVDENRIYLAGISRGGHLAWDLAIRWPDLPAAVAPMIGAPRLNTAQGQNNLRYLENVVRLPIRDLQGSKDDPRMVGDLRHAFEKLKGWHATDAQLLEFAERGHDFDFGAVDWQAFLGQSVRDPLPKTIVRTCTSRDEGRAFWVEVLQTGKTAQGKLVEEEFRPTIKEAEWEKLDDTGKRLFFEREAEARTARLQIEMSAPGRFKASASGVTRFRLLLTREQIDAKGGVDVELGAKHHRPPAAPSKQVLVLEFVERFDRTFLPIAEVVVPQ